jgi:Matrixin
LSIALNSLPVAAQTSCTSSTTCRWTQMSNGNWSAGNGSPYCSPCVAWPIPSGGGVAYLPYRNAWQGDGSMYEHESDWAINQWSSLQYYSPVFHEAGWNDSVSLTYNAAQIGNNCGTTYLYWGSVSQGNQADLTGATVYLNSNDPNTTTFAGYSDTVNNDGRCDLRNTLLHETGHVFGEGHSSFSKDLMYPSNNNVETIDADAQDMMLHVYGSYEAGCTSDCSGTADVALPTLPVRLHPMTPQQLQQAITLKLTAAKTAALATEKDAGNIVADKERCPGLVAPQYTCAAGPPK